MYVIKDPRPAHDHRAPPRPAPPRTPPTPQNTPGHEREGERERGREGENERGHHLHPPFPANVTLLMLHYLLM